jgi:uncharacterized protein YabE (DUF348 family)
VSSESFTAERPRRRVILTWNVPTWFRGLLVLGLGAVVVFLLSNGLERTRTSVVVDVDGHRTPVRTHVSTVGAMLRQAGVVLHPEDLVSPGLETPLEPGMSVQVQKARPVLVSADGQTFQIRTHATTVGELLMEAGKEIAPADEILLNEQPVPFDTSLGSTSRSLQPGVPATGSEAVRQVSYRGGLRLTAETGTGAPPVVTLRRAVTLTLDEGGRTAILHSTATTLGQVLHEHGLTLFLGDQVTPSLQDRIMPGMRVTILRSVPVQIEVDGHTIRTRTLAETVAGVLGQEGIALQGKDRSEPDLTEGTWPDMTIRITRVREEFLIEYDPIPFETVWVPDPEVEIDNIRLAQEGQVGLNKRRFRVIYENDQEVARTLEDSWAERPPITKTLAYGTRIVVRTIETPDGPIEYWRKMRVYTTSYTAATCGKSRDHPRYGYTRLGKWLTKGIVAVDPTVIPLKTHLYVPGYGPAFAGDTGGGVKGRFVDLGFDEWNYESWHWWTDIYVLTPVPPRAQILWILPDLPRFPDRGRR